MLHELQDTAIKSELTALNEKINDGEGKRDDEAKDFFRNCLHEDLHFKKASDTWLDKQDFIKDLDTNNSFEWRNIKDFTFYQLAPDEVLLWCIVEAKKPGEPTPHRYRNMRIFNNVNGNWFLRIWYNYEIKQ